MTEDFAIGFVSGMEVSLPFFNSCLVAQQRYGCGFVSIMSGPVLHRARNELAELFMAGKGGNVDRMLMIDTDIVFTMKHVEAILAHPESVVRGVYANHAGEPVTEGCGFVAIRKRVFHNLGKYPFNPVPLSTGQVSGEDVGFYARCRKEGIEVVTDKSIQVGHLKPQVIMLSDEPTNVMNLNQMEEPTLVPA